MNVDILFGIGLGLYLVARTWKVVGRFRRDRERGSWLGRPISSDGAPVFPRDPEEYR